MVQGRQRGQPQNNVPQPTRQTRLTGRLSPQQSLRKVGPAISEVLRTSVRPKPRGEHPVASRQQKFRPKSGADAILCLDERAEGQHGDDYREPVSRAQDMQAGDSQQLFVPSTRIPLLNSGDPNDKKAPQSQLPMPERRGSVAPPPVKKDAVKVQLPGLLLDRQPNKPKGRRVSKALPSLPPPTPSPCRASFAAPPKPSKDAFESNRDKVIRGQGSPVACRFTAPPMKDMSGSSEYSSASSYDSAEQTWNMINNMMRAVGEEEVRRARESIIRPPTGIPTKAAAGANKTGPYVAFPRMRDAGRNGDGWTSDGNSMSDRTARTSSIDSSSTYCSPVPFKDDLQGEEAPWMPESGTFPRVRPRNTALSVKRRASIASSVFSIVIQPTRELSNDEAQDALVAEDDLPQRIKGILQCTHDKIESTVCSRTWSQSSSTSTSSKGAELHPDLVLTIDALRGISVEDVEFV